MKWEDCAAELELLMRKRITFVFLAIACSAAAQEAVFSDYNCALTPPDGWTASTNLNNKPGITTITFAAPGKTRFVMLMVDHVHKPSGPIDDFFTASYERGATSAGGKLISARYIEVAGLKAYERVGSRRLLSGRDASSIRRVVLTDDTVYTVDGMRTGDTYSVTNDSEIKTSLESFRFLTPPSAPVLSPRAAGARFGYAIGRFGVFVFMGMGVIVVVILVIVNTLDRRSSKPPPM